MTDRTGKPLNMGMIESAIREYIRSYNIDVGDMRCKALFKFHQAVSGLHPEEIRAAFREAAETLTSDAAFGKCVCGCIEMPAMNTDEVVDLYLRSFDDGQLYDLLLHPPDLLLCTLTHYSPGQILEEPYYPKCPGRTKVEFAVNPNAASSINFYLDAPTTNYPDLFAGRSVSFNGDPMHFALDYHLPIYRLVHRYFPSHRINITTDLDSIGSQPYIYVLSPKNIEALWSEMGADFLQRNLDEQVKADLSKGRAIVVINGLHEAFQLSKGLHLVVDALKTWDQKARSSVFFLSGNAFDLKALHDYRRGMPTFRRNLGNTMVNFISGIANRNTALKMHSFHYFEESTRELYNSFYSDYDFIKRVSLLEGSAQLRHFLCLNRIVKDFRVALSFFFWSHRLLSKTAVSQAEIPVTYPAGKPILKIPNKEDFDAFYETLPWFLDTASLNSNLWNVIPEHALNNSFLWVVTESNFSGRYGGRSIFFTEKTFKPIAFFMPFILVADHGALAKLRDLGYRTFSDWWDESYDLEPNRIKRLEKIKSLLYDLSLLDRDELLAMYRNMRGVLEHNHHVLMHNTSGKHAVNDIVNVYCSLQQHTAS